MRLVAPPFNSSHQMFTKRSTRSSNVGARAKRSSATRQSSCRQARRQLMLKLDIRDDDSQIVGLAVTARDITERKRAEIAHERLIELEETLRRIQKMETLGQLTG